MCRANVATQEQIAGPASVPVLWEAGRVTTVWSMVHHEQDEVSELRCGWVHSLLLLILLAHPAGPKGEAIWAR